jgi:hypothetical protein
MLMQKMILKATVLCWMAAVAVPASAATPQPQQAEATMMAAKVEPFAEFVSPADSLPQLRYFADGKTTLNDRCPVRKVRLNPRMGASYVNDHPVGFC